MDEKKTEESKSQGKGGETKMLDRIFTNLLRGKAAKVEGTKSELRRVQTGMLKLAARRRSLLGDRRVSTTKQGGALYIRCLGE